MSGEVYETRLGSSHPRPPDARLRASSLARHLALVCTGLMDVRRTTRWPERARTDELVPFDPREVCTAAPCRTVFATPNFARFLSLRANLFRYASYSSLAASRQDRSSSTTLSARRNGQKHMKAASARFGCAFRFGRADVILCRRQRFQYSLLHSESGTDRKCAGEGLSTAFVGAIELESFFGRRRVSCASPTGSRVSTPWRVDLPV
ncbi:hypothetical protein GALL_306750 [mine drainage metagenome]|uniref:Uncharacterized protein n=1 Tax=mine drainage metagenome TaxID=410659 RepID=A0A1J5RH72_9ZZZZ